MHLLKVFLIFLPIFLVVDLLWIGVFMKEFYNSEIGELARRNGTAMAPRWGAVLLVYLLIPAGIVFFVQPRLLSDSTHLQSFMWGAIYGFILYGVYDLTNLSVLEKWTVKMTAVDMLWGTILCGSMTIILRFIDKWVS